jgi:hypothetical protein
MNQTHFITIEPKTQDKDRCEALLDTMSHLRANIKNDPNYKDLTRHRILYREYLESCVYPASYLGIPQIGVHDCADRWLLDNTNDDGLVIEAYAPLFGSKFIRKLLIDRKALRAYLKGYFCFFLYDYVKADNTHGLGPIVKTQSGYNYVTPLIVNLSRIFHVFKSMDDLREFQRILSVHSNSKTPLTKETIQKLLKGMYEAFVAIHSRDLKKKIINGYRPIENLSINEIHITPGIARHEVAHEQAAYCTYATMMYMKFWIDRDFSLYLQELHI